MLPSGSNARAAWSTVPILDQTTVTEVVNMSALSRWDPIREATSLRDAMNQLFEQAVMRPGFGPFGSVNTGILGQMNVLEAEGKYYCQVLLPGVNADAIDL